MYQPNQYEEYECGGFAYAGGSCGNILMVQAWVII